ncbi:hypothetical protein [Hymenobacter defluvii]|uniref:DUF4142 domain-containing protein n=1 Tax=Hymenobacter defluvii TaxID=2054411 RepID=A0ABS3TIG1_9BACT|nr:hypothetical protein [Hymenobacter defluvii]MBO3272953.1 hypothetical protein [Hymenobacter defluvii]
MKTPYSFLLSGLLLLSSCGQDAASKEAEARVTASIKQLLVQTSDSSYVQVVHTWYKSDVPNTIKLNPRTESIYRTHAEILQEVATQEPKLVAHPMASVDQAQGIRTGYKKLVDESTANVQELSNLAAGTSMSEAEQLKYVSDLADKETHQLALVKYYGKRTAAALAQKEQTATNKRLMRNMWGHE